MKLRQLAAAFAEWEKGHLPDSELIAILPYYIEGVWMRRLAIGHIIKLSKERRGGKI